MPLWMILPVFQNRTTEPELKAMGARGQWGQDVSLDFRQPVLTGIDTYAKILKPYPRYVRPLLISDKVSDYGEALSLMGYLG